MNIKNKIYTSKIYLLGKPILEADKDIFLNFIGHLLEKNDRKECQIIYRGESKNKLFEIYNSSDFTSFGHSLFLIGQKGKGYLKMVYGKTEHLRKWNIGDILEDDFVKIFLIFYQIITEISGVPKYADFYNANKSFVEYFGKIDKVEHFISTLKELKYSYQIKVRDYYLIQVHQFKDENYYPVSMMLSTTTNLKEAEKFSKKGNDKLIIVGWIPKSLNKNKYRINFKYLNSIDKILSNNDLPIVEKRFYPSQMEITLKGGLMPHYIVGYICKNDGNEDVFEINPALLKVGVENEEWIQNGLPINQEGIWEKIKRTQLSGIFYVNIDGYFFDINE